TETIQAIVVKAGYTTSNTAAITYTIAPALPAPTFSPAPGTFTSSIAVQIADAASGATIYYTTNGTTPTASSTQYTGGVWLNASQNFTAIAIEKGYTNSPVVTGNFT